MRSHQYKVLLKKNVKIKLLANSYLHLSFSATSVGIGIPLAWIESHGRSYFIFKKEIGLAEEVDYAQVFTAIIRKANPEEERDKVVGPCLLGDFVKKIVDAKTGEQLWPKPAK